MLKGQTLRRRPAGYVEAADQRAVRAARRRRPRGICAPARPRACRSPGACRLPPCRWRSARRCRTINRKLHSPIPLPASAENLQEDFSFRLNKDLATIVSPLPMAASDGRENVTGRSRHRGSTRSIHSLIANMSPASAASTALRVNPSASPSSKVAAASVTLFREPRRRPAGLPGCPGWNSRLAHAPAAAAQSRRSSSCFRVVAYFVYIYEIWHCVNSNRALGRSSPEPDVWALMPYLLVGASATAQ